MCCGASWIISSKSYLGISSIVCDVTDKNDVDRMAAEVGDFDILVNNAGLAHRARRDEEQSEEWHKIMFLIAGLVCSIFDFILVWGRTCHHILPANMA